MAHLTSFLSQVGPVRCLGVVPGQRAVKDDRAVALKRENMRTGMAGMEGVGVGTPPKTNIDPKNDSFQ